jgi:hypothetical protein
MDPIAPEPRPKRHGHRLRVWRCGYCNARCKTILAPGGLCALCRQQQPPLFSLDATPDAASDSKERP